MPGGPIALEKRLSTSNEYLNFQEFAPHQLLQYQHSPKLEQVYLQSKLHSLGLNNRGGKLYWNPEPGLREVHLMKRPGSMIGDRDKLLWLTSKFRELNALISKW